MENQHMNQQSFAQLTGIGSASLSSIFNGRTSPTINHVKAIKKCFPNINSDWLIYGEGGMFEPAYQANAAATQYSENASTMADASAGVQQQQSAKMAEGMLDFTDDTDSSSSASANVSQPSQRSYQRQHQQAQAAPQRTVQSVGVMAPPHRRITEIRVFFDDQTWESFVPKK